MKTYELTYARTIVLTRRFKAKTLEAAEKKAILMEQGGELGLVECDDTLTAKRNSIIDDITDQEAIWEVAEVV